MRGRGALPLFDASFGRASRRTTFVRAALAGLLALLLGLSFAAAKGSGRAAAEALPDSGSVVVAVDVSASVSRESEPAIATALATVADARRASGAGLVLFADVAAEALPPGTSAAELRRFVPFFRAERDDPWSGGLGFGTSISAGLRVAREALRRDAGGRGRVVLVSDLAAASADVELLRRELRAYRLDPSLDLRVVALPESDEEDKAFFRANVGAAGLRLDPATLAARPGEETRSADPFPRALVLLAVLAGLALALVELRAVPFAWREDRAAGGRA